MIHAQKFPGKAFAFALLFPILPVCAAGFDCDKAATQAEHLICDDPALSELDDSLAAAYQAYRDSAADPVAFIRDQKTWLSKTRSRCGTRECLEKAYRARIPEIRGVKKMIRKRYVSKAFGIEFDLPGNRNVVEEKKYDRLRIVGPAMGGSEFYLMLFVYPGDLEKGLANNLGYFEKRDGEWHPVCDRLYPPAEAFSGAGWKGIKASMECDVHAEEGSRPGRQERFVALFSDGKKYIVATSEGDIGNDPVDIGILQSIRFSD